MRELRAALEARVDRYPGDDNAFGAHTPRDHQIAHALRCDAVTLDVVVDPKRMHGKIGHDADDRGRVVIEAFILRHRAAWECMRAHNRVGALALDERAQIAGGELMGPGAKGPDLSRAFGAVVDVAVHLRNCLDHPQIPIRDHARNDQCGILVRIDDLRVNLRVELPQRKAHGVGRRDVPDANARREKKDAD